ncbi:MAG: transporter [Cytophagaceae bacterium]|nr:transporter [Cytophagaceae bacterium]
MKTTIASIITLLFSFLALSQNNQNLTLNECIEIALKNNLDLKTAKLSAETSTVNYKRNRNALLPSINGNWNYGISQGRSIDPYTNDFVNERLEYSNAGLGLDATVFNGFRLLNSLKQGKLNMEAAEMQVEEAKQNLVLDVTLAFLQALNSRELLKLAENRIASTREQAGRLKTMFEEESGNPAEYRDLQGQVASDEASLVSTRNSLTDALLNLAQLMNVDYEINADGLALLMDFKEYGLSPKEVYDDALNNLATFKTRELQLAAAQKGVAVARAQYTPEVSFFANLNTNYSSAARLFNENGTLVEDTGAFVNYDGQVLPVFTENTQFAAEEISYRDQFDNNLNSSIGVYVSVPIFNGWRAKQNVQLEKIKRDQAQTNLEQTELQLSTNIKQAYYDMQAALQRFNALEAQVEASEESFRINEIRFNNGVTNSVDYIVSKNNLENARINLANVRYEYMLRVKVLEYYRGNMDLQ